MFIRTTPNEIISDESMIKEEVVPLPKPSPRVYLVSISGSIGSGKSFIMNAIKKYHQSSSLPCDDDTSSPFSLPFDLIMIEEPIESWAPYLDLFYKDNKRYGFFFQMVVMKHHMDTMRRCEQMVPSPLRNNNHFVHSSLPQKQHVATETCLIRNDDDANLCHVIDHDGGMAARSAVSCDAHPIPSHHTTTTTHNAPCLMAANNNQQHDAASCHADNGSALPSSSRPVVFLMERCPVDAFDVFSQIQDMEPEELALLNAWNRDVLFKPHIIYHVHAKTETCITRTHARSHRDKEISADYLTKVCQRYDHVMSQLKKQTCGTPSIPCVVTIDNDANDAQSGEQQALFILEDLEKRLVK